MNPKSFPGILLVPVLLGLSSCSTPKDQPQAAPPKASAESAVTQTPSWSRDDLDFFLHGSMSTEFAPEIVLRAFIQIYPDLFPRADLSHLGLIPDPKFGWPVGFSRKSVPHLGGLSAVGLNCAACHVGDVVSGDSAPIRILGGASRFDAEAFFGAVIVATFRTADAANMKKFLAAYLAETDRRGDTSQKLFQAEWEKQEQAITNAIAADPFGSTHVARGALHVLETKDLSITQSPLTNGVNLAALSTSMLKLFHNMRAALHVPDAPPEKAPPASGPGRNDAFGLLSGALFGQPQPYAPVKYGVVWNIEKRHWVHWDGNTQSPIGRNLLAALGLGAPLNGRLAQLNFALVKRQTDLSERIAPPRYPFATDADMAQRGWAHYQARCASCHEGPENESRLHAPSEIGSDPARAAAFTQAQADRFNEFLAELQIHGYEPSKEPGIRGTQKYWAPSMAGVWARSPYLHNGSVRTMRELLAPPADRSKTFYRGSRAFNAEQMGYSNDGFYLLDTTTPGNSNAGHDYGTDLSAEQKRELIEFLKTL